MTDLRKAAKEALEALEYMHQEKCDYMRRNNLGDPLREDAARLALPAITALRAALAQQEEPVQKPVAWMCSSPELMAKGYKQFSSRCEGDWNIPVYLSPPQRKPLTEEEIDGLVIQHAGYGRDNFYAVARAVERAHGIKE